MQVTTHRSTAPRLQFGEIFKCNFVQKRYPELDEDWDYPLTDACQIRQLRDTVMSSLRVIDGLRIFDLPHNNDCFVIDGKKDPTASRLSEEYEEAKKALTPEQAAADIRHTLSFIDTSAERAKQLKRAANGEYSPALDEFYCVRQLKEMDNADRTRLALANTNAGGMIESDFAPKILRGMSYEARLEKLTREALERDNLPIEITVPYISPDGRDFNLAGTRHLHEQVKQHVPKQ